mmetsp:Transcript_5956/g.23105  ORF Transcript_5956/g.23105 Transcript_5956/m.23105 type:complete len:234 (-) Transcript_5956:899-1600(-)
MCKAFPACKPVSVGHSSFHWTKSDWILWGADAPESQPLLCLALPSLALPCLALPSLALPCLALPRLALPCLAYATHSPESIQRCSVLCASSMGMASRAALSFSVSRDSKASCSAGLRLSKTSTGSKPPGPRRSSRLSSPRGTASVSPAAAISFRFSTARFWMRSTKPCVCFMNSMKCWPSRILTKKASKMSRGCRFMDFASSAILLRICDCRAQRRMREWLPFISSSRQLSRR